LYCSPDVLIEVLDHGTDIDSAIGPDKMTALEFAAYQQRIDAMRVLLQRGASADHVGARGLNAFFYSSYPRPAHWQKVPSKNTFNILNEYIHMDPTATWDYGGTALHAAAMFSLGSDIDALVALGCDVDHVDKQESTALLYAVKYGNPSAYFALLRNGAKMDRRQNTPTMLLVNAIMCKAELTWGDFVTPDYDTIVRHLLRECIPLGCTYYIYGNESWPADVTDRDITFQEYAAIRYGRQTESWLTHLLRECGHLAAADRYKYGRMNHPTLDAEDVHQGHVVGDATEGSSGNFPENIDGYEDGSGESSPRCKNCRTIDDELFYDAVETW
jgi:hypothetical protein